MRKSKWGQCRSPYKGDEGGREKGISDLRMRLSGHRWLMMMVMAPSRAARCGVDRGRGESERVFGTPESRAAGAGDESMC